MAEEQKKKDSMLKDISKQAIDDIIVPKTLEATNNMAVEIINMIADSMIQIVGRLIFKDKYVVSRTSSVREKYSNITRNKYQSQTQSAPISSARRSDKLEYVCVDTHQKAEEIKNDLIASIKKYERVRTADLYLASGKITPIATDYRFGWTNVDDVHYTPCREGYWFNMPDPIQIQ